MISHSQADQAAEQGLPKRGAGAGRESEKLGVFFCLLVSLFLPDDQQNYNCHKIFYSLCDIKPGSFQYF